MKKRIVFNNEVFLKINTFDCRIVDLERPGGGTTFTTLPVSTQSRIDIKKDENRTIFNITDDWGKIHVMSIPNSMHEAIAIAIKSADKINKANNKE